MRIVSLLPSATEIVCALEAKHSLVGRSSECDYPATIRALPAVMRPNVDDSKAPSGKIDERVRATRARSESLYHLDVDLLRSLRPDLLLTQDLCSVCSVTEAEAAEACAVAGIRPRVLSLSPRTLREVGQSIETVGEAIGNRTGVRALVDRLHHRGSGPEAGDSSGRPTIAVVEWLDPPILAGLWVDEMVKQVGGRSIGPGEGEPGERTTWEAISRQRPDLVIVSPCSFSVDRTRAEPALLRAFERIGASPPRLGAWLADEAFFSRPGPRLSEGIALLEGLSHGADPRVAMPFEPWVEGSRAS
ncbi:MAG: cobalamin-binding protein [Thermoplasmata archaeon]|nr:cobalamin-binding protein [Thermoplasmata archaeon]MCI4359382.1 cobalamin-binding protein [Thermoplasmata archaeon]